jgi:hypothetical protein
MALKKHSLQGTSFMTSPQNLTPTKTVPDHIDILNLSLSLSLNDFSTISFLELRSAAAQPSLKFGRMLKVEFTLCTLFVLRGNIPAFHGFANLSKECTVDPGHLKHFYCYQLGQQWREAAFLLVNAFPPSQQALLIAMGVEAIIYSPQSVETL